MQDNTTNIAMSEALQRLWSVIDGLLGPEGCPWDKKQTPVSLCDYVIEEAFELVDAIRSGDHDSACEEIGDLAFLLLFLSRLYKDSKSFTPDEPFEQSASKMIRRHPHVFDALEIDGQEELLRNWEKIKRTEQKAKDENSSFFSSLPAGLPPLLKAYRIHSKAARIGFTWENDESMAGQLDAEWNEWLQAKQSGDAKEMEQEFGDYIFTLAEYGRRHGIKANAALDYANIKFLKRFELMEELAKERNLDIGELPLEEQNKLWDEAKSIEES